MAAALANIARGAATGGLHGAVIGTVKSFLPELLKVACMLLILLILLPFMVFAALPNIMFGFDSSADAEVTAMTNQASVISTAYTTVDAATQKRIDEIVRAAQASYAAENEEAFDELKIDLQTENTNIYWFIAINSVEYEQDLYAMSPASIRNLIITKLVWSWSLILQPVDTGESGGMIRLLRVNISDLNPDELMDKLGFTAEERNWAEVLYSTLVDDQWVDTGGVGGGIDLGDFTFSEVTTPVVYYSQLDSRWCNKMYGTSGTIGAAGCGPTALAIVVASLAKSSVTPVETAKWSVESGHRCEGNGSYHSVIPDGAQYYGLTATGIGIDAKKLVQALEDGKLVVALMSKGHFTKGGHFIVLRGVTEDGQILVADPASTSRSNQKWDLSIFPAEARRGAAAGGPFWVISK